MIRLNFLSLITTFIISMMILNETTAQNNYNHTKSHDGRHKTKVKTPFTSFEIEYEGEIIISDNDEDIVGITDGGFFKVKKSAFGSKRRVEINANRNGQLTKKYYVGRREKTYIPDGKEWLAEMLSEIFRTTTLGAESRTARIYEKGGVDAMINEIEDQYSDHVKAHYFGLLLDKDLNDQELADIIESTGDEIKSDYYLSSILKDNRDAFLATDAVTNAYIEAAESISSDHYLSEVLREALVDNSIDEQQVSKLLDLTESISSDHYITEVLNTLIADRDINDNNLKKILVLSETISSDHYKTELLKEAINTRRSLDDSSLLLVLEALEDVSSDHYATEIIKEIKRQDLSDPMIAKVISYSADNIHSDHYLAESLKEMINKYDIGGASLDAIVEGLDNIGSDHYAAEVVEDLADQRNLSEDQLIKILDFIGDINSDHYLTESLKQLAPHVSECGSQVAEAYKKAAKNISSDTYYGRALKAID